MLCMEGICGCDVQLNAEFRAEIKASPHPDVLPCVMPTLKSWQPGWAGAVGREPGAASPILRQLCACTERGSTSVPTLPARVSGFRAASSGVQVSWKEPLFPSRQSLSLWRKLGVDPQ